MEKSVKYESPHYVVFTNVLLLHHSYWLLLRGGIVQSVPCAATIFWSIVQTRVSSIHSWFIHQCFMALEDTSSSEAEVWWEMSFKLSDGEFLTH
jgi:hypothetical protein